MRRRRAGEDEAARQRRLRAAAAADAADAATADAAAEISRLRAELHVARAHAEGAEVRAREAAISQADAERHAAAAFRSSVGASRTIDALRAELAEERRGRRSAQLASEKRLGVAQAELAELSGVRGQYKAKWEEAEKLRDELAHAQGALAQREALYGRRELEMRGIRARCLSMVHALRAATRTLSSEQREAQSVLEGHFEMLESSVAMSWLERDEA